MKKLQKKLTKLRKVSNYKDNYNGYENRLQLIPK